MDKIDKIFWTKSNKILLYNIHDSISDNIINYYKKNSNINESEIYRDYIYTNLTPKNPQIINKSYKIIKEYDLIIYDDNSSKYENSIYKFNKIFNLLKINSYFIIMMSLNNYQLNRHILKNVLIYYDTLTIDIYGESIRILIKKSLTKNLMTHVINMYPKLIEDNINFKLLTNLHYLPKYITNESIQIILNVIYNSTDNIKIEKDKLHRISSTKGDIYKYPVFVNENKLYYTDTRFKNYESEKIILNKKGILKPFYIKEHCHVNRNNYYITVKNKEEAKKILKRLKSKEVKQYLEYYYINQKNNPLILNYIKM
jgi:hypothetical protein